jgi:hypothetical protein
MLVNRVTLEIGDTLVEREQDPIGSKGGIHNCRVCRTAKSFAGDRVRIVAQAGGDGRDGLATSPRFGPVKSPFVVKSKHEEQP